MSRNVDVHGRVHNRENGAEIELYTDDGLPFAKITKEGNEVPDITPKNTQSYSKAEIDEKLEEKADKDDAVEIITISDPSTKLSDVANILSTVNAEGRHVFFDVSSLGVSMYLCTIFIDSDETNYKIMDNVVGKIAEGSYDPDRLLVSAIAETSFIAVQDQIDILQKQIDELGGTHLIEDYEVLGNKILDGTSTDVIKPGDTIDINWIQTVTGSTNNNGVVTCSDMQKFIDGVGECEATKYIFIYDGSSWTYNNNRIDISEFGLSVSGTRSEGEVMTITTTVRKNNYTFTGYDKSTPHDNDVPHNWTLEKTYAPDIKSYDTYESAFILAPGKTVPAGNYYLTNYSHKSGQNLTIYFTIQSNIENNTSSILQFASAGYKQEGSHYIPSAIRPYSINSELPVANSITCSMTEISGAVNITTIDGVSLPGSFDFAVFGNNNWEYSNIRQYLNNSNKDNQYSATHDFDRPSGYNNQSGFLYGMDPRAKALLVDIDNKFTAGYGNAGYIQNQTYICTDKVFLLSMKEMSFNINTLEGSVMDLYGEYTNNTLTNDAIAARAKYNRADGTLNNYRWSRSASVGFASSAWYVTSSGAYGGGDAYNGFYVAPAFCFGKHSS